MSFQPNASEQRGPERTVWLPGEQTHEIGERGGLDLLRGPSWTVHRSDGPGVALATKPALLPAGAYTVLVPLQHRCPSGKRVATIEVVAGGSVVQQVPVVARRTRALGWQRATARFALEQAASTVVRVLTPGGHRLWTANVCVCPQPPRPFYVIAHMRNSPASAARALDLGANAIECDITARIARSGRIELDAHHGFSIPYPRRGLVGTPLREYVAALAPLAERLALLVLDCKPSPSLAHDYRAYGQALAELVAEHLPASRVMISVHDPSMVAVFEGAAAAGFAAGRDVNIIDNSAEREDPQQWIRFAEQHDLTALGIGTDCFVVGNLLMTWFAPVAAAVNGRDRRQRVKKIYYWTLQSRPAIRKMLDYGIDGLIVNSPRGLREVLAEPPFDELYRLATPKDSQFVVHGLDATRDHAPAPRPLAPRP